MARFSLPAAAVIAAALAPPVAAQEPEDDGMITVAGVAVDADGNPLEGLTVAPFWIFDDGERTPSREVAVTDADGRFEGKVKAWRKQFVLTAYSDDFETGGYVITVRDKAMSIEIRCGKVSRVHGTVTCSEIEETPGWFNSYWNIGKQRLARCASSEGKFEVLLPPGRYRWNVYGGEFEDWYGAARVEGDGEAVDIGEVDLPAGFVAKHKGKTLPKWNVTAARGVDVEKSQISDFAGKWLLIEFWGFW